MAVVGINPILLNKLLPIVLGLFTTGYCFGVSMQMLPVPAAGFIATLLLNQNLWLKDDLVSATGRAFVYPLFLAFLYYLLRRSLLPCVIAIALQGLFYPQCVFISAALLLLPLRWVSGRLRLSQYRSDYLFCAAGLGVALLVMLPYALSSSAFGPVVTATEARALPEFLERGRTRFFLDSPLEFWLYADRSGIFPVEWSRLPYNYFPVMLGIGLLLPLLLQYPSRFPLVRHLTNKVKLLPQIALVSFGWFFAAHLLLFKLYLPSRYTVYSLRILMALLAAITLTVMLDAVFHAACKQSKARFFKRKFLALGSTVLLFSALLLYPNFLQLTGEWRAFFLNNSYIPGGVPALYEFFQKQPKDTLIASLSDEASNLPAFTKRSIWVSKEQAIPYHIGYYRAFRQRLADLIRAQYSQNLAETQNLIRMYGVDFLLLERAAFTPEYLATNSLLAQFQQTAVEDDQLVRITTEAVSRLQQGNVPALVSVIERCSVFEIGNFVVLPAECISNSPT